MTTKDGHDIKPGMEVWVFDDIERRLCRYRIIGEMTDDSIGYPIEPLSDGRLRWANEDEIYAEDPIQALI